MYDYECLDCGHQFESITTVAERAKAPDCPKCEGAAKQVLINAPAVKDFVGSDRHRSKRDAWLQMVTEAQNEGIRSQTELEVGLGQAHDLAAKRGIPVERILGQKGRKKETTPEVKAKLSKAAKDQYNAINR